MGVPRGCENVIGPVREHGNSNERKGKLNGSFNLLLGCVFVNRQRALSEDYSVKWRMKV